MFLKGYLVQLAFARTEITFNVLFFKLDLTIFGRKWWKVELLIMQIQ